MQPAHATSSIHPPIPNALEHVGWDLLSQLVVCTFLLVVATVASGLQTKVDASLCMLNWPSVSAAAAV